MSYYGYQPIKHGFATENPPPSNPNGLPSPTRPAPPMPTCKPPKSHTKMLEKLLDFAHKGAISNEAIGADFYTKGKQVAYEEMWEHIARILRKECDNE